MAMAADDAMDFIASPLGTSTSDESCWSAGDGSGSTSPTTSASSPFFGPAKAEDNISFSLSQSLNIPVLGRSRIEPDGTPDSSLVRNICVVGAGYVGGPTAAVLALHNPNITVNVVDRDPRRIQKWQSPHLPVHEPGLIDVVRVSRDGAESHDAASTRTTAAGTLAPRIPRHPNLFFTTDATGSISQADVIFLAVNTPTKTFGLGAGRATDMTAVDEAVREIAVHARREAIIVEKSTVPCGTAQRVREVLSSNRPNTPFEVLSNPEFLAEGSAMMNLNAPDRVLIGSSNTPSGHRAARILTAVYTSWVPSTRILRINTWSSELAKLVANAMLAQRISSINSVSAICERTGADVDQISRAVGLDPRIGPQFLKAGLGFGGSCFRKDIASLTYLAESLGLDDVAHYWQQVNVMNEMQRDRFARRVITRLEGNLVGKKLTLLGFAFKKNTGDPRESLAVDVIRLLLEERPSEIAVFDPFCREEDILREVENVCGETASASVKVYGDPYLACSQTNAVLVITDCDQFHNNTPARRAFSKTSIPDNTDVMCQSTLSGQDVYIANGRTYYLLPQDTCPLDCVDCRTASTSPMTLAPEPLEWARVAYNMKEPKWVFDGRGILDVREMERLGLRVDVVGRRC